MSDNSNIEWCDATWNIITGCSVESPACTNCYAMRLAGTRLREHPSRKGLTKIVNGKPVWTGEVRFNEQWLMQPLQWKRPRKIFVCAHADLFHPNVPDEWIDRIFAVMALAPWHTFMVLTKRPKRMCEHLSAIGDKLIRYRKTGGGPLVEALGDIAARIPSASRETAAATYLPFIDPTEGKWPLPNVMLGVTAEDQKRADERIPHLLATPAAKRFVSIEPMLGETHLMQIAHENGNPCHYYNAIDGYVIDGTQSETDRLDLVIVGGESGPGARPMHPDWARSIRDQCATAGVPFMFKQWGDWAVTYERANDPDWRHAPSAKDTDERYLNLAGGCGFHGERVVFVRRVGKSRAGRLLDGVEHNGTLEDQ